MSKEHARTGTKAEVFEDTLACVSRALTRAAKASADELRGQRLAAAGSAQSGVPKAAGKARKWERPRHVALPQGIGEQIRAAPDPGLARRPSA